MYLFVKKKECLTSNFHFIVESLCHTYNGNLLTIFHVGVRTASVIIALTDGELQDVQFYYAEQEVSHLHIHPNCLCQTCRH